MVSGGSAVPAAGLDAAGPDVTAPPGFGSRWQTVRGLRLHALRSDGGPGPPVLLLPGLVTASRSMVPLARALAGQGRRVWILDPPGFGYSDKPRGALPVGEQAALVAGWLAAAGRGPVPVLGNSFGSQVAAAVAADHPALVERVVLLSPTARPAVRRRLSWLGALPARSGPGASTGTGRPGRRRVRLLARVHGTLGDEPSLRVLNVAEYGCASVPRAVGTLRWAVLEPIEATMPRVGVPALVIRADHDRLSSPDWARHLAGLAPDGRLARLPGLGHDAFFQAADAVAAVIAPFLDATAGLPSRAGGTSSR